MKADSSKTSVHICQTFLYTNKTLDIDLGRYLDKVKHKGLKNTKDLPILCIVGERAITVTTRI
jgi:hypothetical protein